MPVSFTDLFCGGGLMSAVASSLGVAVVNAVDCNSTAIAIHQANFPDAWHYTLPVQETDWSALYPTDWVHASPPCTRASSVNVAFESREDLANAGGVVRCLEAMNPSVFTLENVPNYQKFQSYEFICAHLQAAGYEYREHLGNAMAYGCPQSRERLLLIAFKRGERQS